MGKQTFCELRRKNIILMSTPLSTWYRENCKYNDFVNVTLSDFCLLWAIKDPGVSYDSTDNTNSCFTEVYSNQ